MNQELNLVRGELLRQIPLFESETNHVLDLLTICLTPRRLTEQQILIREGERSDVVYIFVEGELIVSQGERIITSITRPEVVGLNGFLSMQSRNATVSAARESLVYEFRREDFFSILEISPNLMRKFIGQLAMQTIEAQNRSNSLIQHMDDFFVSPNAQLIPGPYIADLFEMIVLVVRDDSARLRELLPNSLRPLPGLDDIYLLTFNFFPKVYSTHPAGHGKSFCYNETTPFIPCLGPNLRPGFFCPELYPDNFLAITLGREMYGFPKRFGMTKQHGNSVELILSQQRVLRAQWERETSVNAHQFADTLSDTVMRESMLSEIMGQLSGTFLNLVQENHPLQVASVPVFVRKIIPDVSSSGEMLPAIDELVEIPFQVKQLEDFRVLEGTDLAFFDETHFLYGQALGGFALKMSFEFGAGHKHHNYLLEREQKSKRRRGIGLGQASTFLFGMLTSLLG